MITEILNLSVNGQPADDLVPDIIEVEVEEDARAADAFRVRISIAVNPDGTWTYADDQKLAIWNRITIQGGYPEDNATLIDGYITHLELSLSDTEDSYLEISGMDASAMMDLEDRQLAWSSKRDDEIAREIFSSYGLSCEVEDTLARPDESICTLMQSESDIRFLRRLAARNGFECYVQGSRGYFRSPNFQEPPQKLLAINFGPETNLASLRAEVDGTPPTRLEIRRIDPMEKREERESLTETPRRVLGRKTLRSLRAGAREGRRLIKQQISSSSQQMRGRLRGGYAPADEFVAISGEVDSRSYGAVLRAKRLVTIKGAGANFSGIYYITRVRHLFTTEGYEQSFEGYRNGLGVTGEENFISPSGLLAAATGAQSTSISTGNLVVPTQKKNSTIRGGS